MVRRFKGQKRIDRGMQRFKQELLNMEHNGMLYPRH